MGRGTFYLPQISLRELEIYYILKLSLLHIIQFRGRFVIQKLVLFPGLERWQILATDGAVVPTGLHMLRLNVLKQAGFELSVPGTIQTPPQSTISNHLPQHCLGDTVKTI